MYLQRLCSRSWRILSLLLVCFTLSFALLWSTDKTAPAFAAPPDSVDIVPGAAWSDTNGSVIQAHGGGITKVGSTYYWFGEDKTQGSPFQNINCYSSTDLVRWTFVNRVLTRQASGDLGPNRIIERPKVIYNNSTQQYVMYMHVDSSDYSDARVGVATSSTVCGNYSYHGSFRPLGQQSRDIGLFKDDDGSAYLLSEDRAHGLQIYRLSADYLSVTSLVVTLATYESPALFKTNGRYYLLGSQLTGWNTNDNRYTTATSLSGPWSAWANFAPSGQKTFNSQTTFVLPVTGTNGTTFVFMGDRWLPSRLSDSSYIWLPLQVNGTSLSLNWHDSWSLNVAAGTWQDQLSDTIYEAEATSNTSAGGARTVSCSSCSGSQAVGWLGNGGTLQLNNVTPSSAGLHTLKIWYTNGDSSPRSAQITVNGSATTRVSFPHSGGGNVIHLAVTTIHLNAGNNTIQISNPSGYAPDIDLIAIPDVAKYYRLVNRNSNKSLDVSSSSTTPGAQTVQWSTNNNTSQHWQLVVTSSGYYKLVNRNSKLYLDVSDNSTSTNARVIQWHNTGGNNQQWRLVLTSNGYYNLVNRHSRLYLDVTSASTADGTVIIQYTSNGGANQQWQLIPV